MISPELLAQTLRRSCFRGSALRRRTQSLILISLCSCVGSVSDASPEAAFPGAEAGVPPGSTPPDPTLDPVVQAALQPPALRLIPPLAFKGIALDLFGAGEETPELAARIEAALRPLSRLPVHKAGPFDASLPPPDREALLVELDAAERLAALAFDEPEVAASLFPCSAGSATCVEESIHKLARRMFGRAIAPADVAPFLGVYVDLLPTEGHEASLESTLVALLASPSVHYRGAPAALEPGDRLRGLDLPRKLAEAAWLGLPDERLLAAAEEGRLDTPEGLATEVDRLLSEARRTTRTHDAFFEQWLLNEFDNHDTGDPIYDAMRHESRTFWRSLLQDSQTYEELLTAPYTYADAETAELYGLPAPAGETSERVAVDPSTRAGVLTQPAVLASTFTAYPEVHRGLFILQDILCNHEVLEVPDDVESTTSQERLADAKCKGCHQIIDPVGSAFDPYDGLGRFRAEDVEAAGGELTGVPGDVAGEFADIPTLARRVGASETGPACYARQWLRFTLGRVEDRGTETADAQYVQRVFERFQQTGHLADALREVLLAPQFATVGY